MTNPPAVMSTSDAPVVQTREADGVLLITINRPKVRNAVDGATARALAQAFDQLDARDDLAVGVLTGAGGTFSAGMDLKAFAAGDTPLIPGRGFAGLTRARPRAPLIAAVEGWARTTSSSSPSPWRSCSLASWLSRAGRDAALPRRRRPHDRMEFAYRREEPVDRVSRAARRTRRTDRADRRVHHHWPGR